MTTTNIYEPRVCKQVRKLVVRGVNYSVNEWGSSEAPQLIFLHGWADAGTTFQFVVDQLAKDWFVVAPDWRGFGNSHLRCEGYWFPDYVADLHEILDYYCAERAANLVGHSMGANIASLYAGCFPERVGNLVNIEGFGLPDADPEDAPGRYRKWIEAAREKPTYADYPNFDALAHRVEKRSPGIPADKAQFVARAWAATSASGRVELLADPSHKLPNAVLYRRAEAEACWRNIKARVLLVAGSDSTFTETFGGLQALPFPAAQFVTIDNVGHMIHFEAPADLARAIEDFL